MKRTLARIFKFIPSGVTSIILIGVVIYLSLRSNPLGPYHIHLFKGSDKFVHFIMYYVLCTGMILDYAKYKMPHHIKYNPASGITAFCIVLGMILELTQGVMSAGRELDYYDELANACGAITAVLMLKFWLMHRFRKLMLPLYSRGSRHHHHRKVRHNIKNQ